jgi:molybdopterin molybdotransferase
MPLTKAPMITVEEALAIVARTKIAPHAERTPLSKALGRILAKDVVSRISMPPFDKSAMDGYACRAGDPSLSLRIVEMIPAGGVPSKAVKPGECAKIMTGGMMPRGADRVVRRELAVEEDGIVRDSRPRRPGRAVRDNRVVRFTGADEATNICRKGEDVRPGAVVLKKGVVLRPQEIGILASMGTADVEVFERPSVGVIATGSEIVTPGRPLKPGRIYDSNSYSLAAQVERCGAAVKVRRRAADTPADIRRAVSTALESCRLVLVSGGVSAGDLDYVPAVLRDLGVRIAFEQIAVQPGKPTVFGTREGRLVFGVPGNPVSTFVVFEVFIKPALYRMMGHVYQPLTVTGTLARAILRRRTERAAFIPVRVDGDSVERPDYHGSAHIHALSGANGLVYVPKGEEGFPEGSRVHVRLL